MEKENNITEAWKRYEQGKRYNNALTPNQYRVVEANTEFFTGNQWTGLPNTPAMRRLPKPVFNILKRAVTLFVASLTSTDVSIRFDPLDYQEDGPSPDENANAAKFANAEVNNLLEKFKFDYRIRDFLFDGAVTGDYCAHFWFDPDAEPYGGAYGTHRGEIQMEMVDGINVMFGNPNVRDVQKQPWIILIGRDTVENLREEAARFRKNKDLYRDGTANPDAGKSDGRDGFRPDSDTQDFPGVGGKIEMEPDGDDGKALYVLMYTKESKYVEKKTPQGAPVYEDEYDDDGLPVFETDADGDPTYGPEGLPRQKRKAVKHWETSVRVTKATRTAIVYENVDTGLSCYPVAWGNWEKQRNQYHGRSLITGLIPNQIFINQMFATVMAHMSRMAFPVTVFNADAISDWNPEPGQIIGVRNLMPGQGVSSVAYTLPAQEMSGQIIGTIDKAMEYTKECLGATDTLMGNANPENTSALMVLQANSSVPLENIRSALYEFVEDIGKVLLDMMGTYYGERPVVTKIPVTDLMTGADGLPVIDPMTMQLKTQSVTKKVTKTYDFSLLKGVWLNLSVKVGASTYYSKVSMVQMLDNLRKDGTLDILQYLERVPDELIPGKDALIDEIRDKMATGQQPNAAAGAAIQAPGTPTAFGQLSPDMAKQGLPEGMEAAFSDLPEIAKKTAAYQGDAKIA